MARSLLVKLLYFYLFILCIPFSFADEYRPAYLELKQTAPDVFNMLWKVPAKGQNQRLALYVKLPDDVTVVGAERSSFVAGAFITHSILQRNGGLVGATIAIDGLEKVSTDVLVRIQKINGSKQVVRLTSDKASFIVAKDPTSLDVAKSYFVFGIEHILEGIDHLLFVACLIFIAGSGRRILITITGFTVAHSLTLTLATLNLVKLPIPPVEAVIALSIVFLAREIASERRDTLTWRYPVLVSASFGLLHGFGFASALGEIGLPPTEIPAALLAFNVGVEIGQILFVAGIMFAVWLITKVFRARKKKALDWLSRIEKPLAYGIGGVTMLWTVERIIVF
jgi:hydrogenase/urease accessory protein HupE